MKIKQESISSNNILFTNFPFEKIKNLFSQNRCIYYTRHPMFSLDHPIPWDIQWPLKPLFLARIIDISADGNWGVGRSKRSVGYRSSPPLGRCIIFTTKYWPAIVHPSTTAPLSFGLVSRFFIRGDNLGDGNGLAGFRPLNRGEKK